MSFSKQIVILASLSLLISANTYAAAKGGGSTETTVIQETRNRIKALQAKAPKAAQATAIQNLSNGVDAAISANGWDDAFTAESKDALKAIMVENRGLRKLANEALKNNSELNKAMLIGFANLQQLEASPSIQKLFIEKFPTEITALKAAIAKNDSLSADAKVLLDAIQKLYQVTPNNLTSTIDMEIFSLGMSQASAIVAPGALRPSPGDFNVVMLKIAKAVAAGTGDTESIVTAEMTTAGGAAQVSSTDQKTQKEEWLKACREKFGLS